MSCTCGCGGHDERHAPTPPHNPPGRTSLDYRVGEHRTFLAAMLDRLASPAHPALRRLTVRTPDDPTIGLLDASALLGDLLTFHSERIADEGYLGTADDQRSLVMLGRLVGHRPRPGVAADTYLAYTVDRDPRGEDPPVLIPAGARSNSVPSATDDDSQTFETSEDLVARWSWNKLSLRHRQPALLTPADLKQRSELFVAGKANSVRPGQKLLLDFGSRQLLLPVDDVRIDRDEDVTAITLPRSPKPSLNELLSELAQWLTPSSGPPSPELPHPRPVSQLIDDVDAQVLTPLRNDSSTIISPAQLAMRLADPLGRLAEAEVLAEPYPEVAEWFGRLRAMTTELRDRARELAPVAPPEPAPEQPEYATHAVTSSLHTGSRTSARPPKPGSGARREAPPGVLSELLAMRVTATPFGATAPLQPVQDDQGRVVRQTDWPLPGGNRTSVRIGMDAAGRKLVRAEFQHTEPGGGWQHVEQLPADEVAFDLGPGRVELSSREETILGRLGFGGGAGERPGVMARLFAELPACSLFVSHPDNTDTIHVTIRNGESLELDLSPQEGKTATFGPNQLHVRYGSGSEPTNVEISLSTQPDATGRDVLPLEGIHDEITMGSRVVIERPQKGAPDGVPGDPALAFVVTHVTAVRTMSYTQYGITGRGTVLTLADPWLDEKDTQLSHIRDTTVHADGEPLRPADEPVKDDLYGNTLELADRHDGLRPGRYVIVSGLRTDVPERATELAVIATTEQAQPQLPGDRVHTIVTLEKDLAYRYRRDTAVVHGNVVPATHGESRDERIGSGEAAKAHQTFTLWQSPLTWLPADNPLGATPTLEVRVDGLRWHPVDSLAGRGPDERVYVTGSTADGRTTVTFGDGVHGARLPTGQENVRARYRFGTGRTANVAPDRITQPVTRPLGVTAVTNPLPATGGTDADDPALTRRTVPLAVSALDRLVSLQDYEDFARSRAGIGRASARRVFDGKREVVHLTVAGVDDVPIGAESALLRSLRASLLEYGDERLPVRVVSRDLVLLVVSARVKLLPDHSWGWVEPRIRQALLAELGYPGRDIGQPAYLSEVLSTAQNVPGVSHVDVDLFDGVPASDTAGELKSARGTSPAAAVPVRHAEYAEERYVVTDPAGETLTEVAVRNGISLDELLTFNPDITDTRRLAPGRTVFVHRGIRPAQLALLAPETAGTLILTEVA